MGGTSRNRGEPVLGTGGTDGKLPEPRTEECVDESEQKPSYLPD